MSEPTARTVTGRADPRALRTRALLRTAALELAAERELDTITIARVAKRATVNRATVYQHYRDREALLLDAMDGELTTLVGLVARCPLLAPPGAAGRDDPPSALVDVFRHLDSRVTLYRRLLGPCGSARFVSRLRQLLAEQVALQLAASGLGRPDEAAVELRAHAAAGALIGLISHWLPRSDQLSAAQAAAQAWQGLRPVGKLSMTGS